MANWVQYDNKYNLLAMVDNQSLLRGKDNNFKSVVARLHRLAEELEKQESELYATLGVKGLFDLQKKIDEINEDKGFRSLNNLADSEFDAMVLAAARGVDLEKPIIFLFEKDNQIKDDLLKLSEELASDDLAELLKELRKLEKAGKTSGSYALKGLHLSSSSGRGVSKTLGAYEIGLDGDKLLLKVTQKSGQVAKRESLIKLADKLNATLIEETSELRKNLEQTILNKIETDKLRNLTRQEFERYGQWYDVNSSKASIKGFLGEIYANVVLKVLFPNLSVYATGNIRDLKGQEIPIDLVLEKYGFQIKNYRVENGETLFRYGGQAGNFIENRVQPEQSLRDLLVTFFGAYQYYGNDKEFIQQAKWRLINGGPITSIFNAHLDNIMRISSTFGAKDNEQGLFLGDPDLYYNTMFIISGTLVPASAMVWAISGELSKSSSSIYKTNWVFSEPEQDYVAKSSDSPNLFANKISIDLYMHLNVAKILNVAKSRAVAAKGIDIKN